MTLLTTKIEKEPAMQSLQPLTRHLKLLAFCLCFFSASQVFALKITNVTILGAAPGLAPCGTGVSVVAQITWQPSTRSSTR